VSRLLAWDAAAERWVNHHHRPFLDWVLLPSSSLGEMAAIWLLVAAGLLILGRGRARITGVVLLSAILVADLGIRLPLGCLFDRTRPYLADPTIRRLGLRWTGTSFPSGHAHSVVIAAIVLGSEYRRLLPALGLFALATLYSRPYLGMHYPLDVLVGTAIGLVVGLAARQVGLAWKARADGGERPEKAGT
jgi:undecaprenyl-diphosphatase